MPASRYTGRIVLAEKAISDQEGGYHDGQYLIYAETERALYGLRLDGPYGGLSVYGLGGNTSPGCLPLTGRAAYHIVAVDEPQPWMLEHLDQTGQEIADVRSGRKKNDWVMSVYDRADNMTRVLRKAITTRLAELEATEPQDDGPTGEAPHQTEDRKLPVIDLSLPVGATVNVSSDCILVVRPQVA